MSSCLLCQNLYSTSHCQHPCEQVLLLNAQCRLEKAQCIMSRRLLKSAWQMLKAVQLSILSSTWTFSRDVLTPLQCRAVGCTEIQQLNLPASMLPLPCSSSPSHMWLHIIIVVSDAKHKCAKSIVQPSALQQLCMASDCTGLERQRQHSLTKYATIKTWIHCMTSKLQTTWQLEHNMKPDIQNDLPCAGSTPPCANMVSLTIRTAGFLASSIAIGAPGERTIWSWLEFEIASC